MEERPAERKGSLGLLALMGVIACAGAALMFRLGMGALGMRGPAMELNKLLDKRTKTCADQTMAEECARILKQIEALEKSIIQKPGTGEQPKR